MGELVKGQSPLRIILQIFCNLKGVISALIKYRKADGSFGAMTAVVSHHWRSFWVFVTFSDNRTATGETASVFVYDEGFG